MKKEYLLKVLKELSQEVKEKYRAKIKGIFGSYAKGEERENSDLDVLVEFASDADLIHFVGLSLFLEEKLGIKVDVVPYDTVREEIKERVFGEVIYL